jgi:hypothetical protein
LSNKRRVTFTTERSEKPAKNAHRTPRSLFQWFTKEKIAAYKKTFSHYTHKKLFFFPLGHKIAAARLF